MSVHSQKEWEFVKNNVLASITANVWIGGYQPNGGMIWKWDDESTFDWTKWGTDQPGVTAGNCMYLWAKDEYKFADTSCNGRWKYPFVCMS